MIRQVSEKGLRPLFRFLLLGHPAKPFFIFPYRLLALLTLSFLSFLYCWMHPLNGERMSGRVFGYVARFAMPEENNAAYDTIRVLRHSHAAMSPRQIAGLSAKRSGRLVSWRRA